MKKILIKDPFCPYCGTVRPMDRTENICVPCANQGHWYRLVIDEKDRLESITRWLSFWSNIDLTQEEIKELPIYENLTKYTFSKIIFMKENAE